MTGLFWIFAVFDAGVLLMLASELTSGRGLRRIAPRTIAPAAAVGTLVASYAAELSVTAYAVFHQAQPAPQTVLPFPLTSAITDEKDLVVAAILALAALQTYVLLRVYRNAPSWRWIWSGAAALVALSVLSPVMITADVYAYVADALLGRLAYAPPAVLPFTGQFAAIATWWRPLPPSPYGPLWLVTAWLVTAPFRSLLGKVVALRLLGAASFAALLGLARALRCPRRIVAAIALNPALPYEYIASAHNDLYGIVLVLGAALLVRRRPVLAALCVVAGGLVKVPFAVIGLVLLRPIRSALLRAFACVVLPGAAVAIGVLAGGRGYVEALERHTTTAPLMSVLTGAVVAASLVSLAVAVFGVRRWRSTVWLLPLAASYTLASYAVWALPYALARRNLVGYVLVALPVATALVEVKFMTVWTLFVIVPAVFAWQIVAMRSPSSARA